MAVKVSLKQLLETGAHFGHQKRRWNPKMEDFLYDTQENVHVFDLTKTKEKLEEALHYLEKVSATGGKIIFLGTKRQAKEAIETTAKNTGSFWINERWLGGTLTNFSEIKKSIDKLEDFKKKREKGEFKIYTKKERVLIDREIDRLERFFGGLTGLNEKPELLVIVDVKKEKAAVREAKREGVPVIGLVDSNADPEIDYPIPMNDDSAGAVEYVLTLMEEAIVNGQKKGNKGKSTAKEEKPKTKKEKES